MKKTFFYALCWAAGTIHAADATQDIDLRQIVKVIDFTGTRNQAEIAQLLPHAEIEQYLQQASGDEENSKPKALEQAVHQSRAVKKAYSYTVRGKRYQTLAHSKGFEQQGNASWYGPGFHGRKTANGEVYDMNELTAAHRELPLGTRVEVTNPANGKKVVVRINDRGPFHHNRVLDLSKAAAKELDALHQGVVQVHIRALH